ncbi:MAG: RHS repeat-associated core domain-containing protein, partial [Methylococcus sp.]
MGAREYAPAAGRFLQLDPLEGGGLNPYEYADSDPLNNSDPEGLLSRGTWAGMAIGLALGAAIILTAATKGAFAGPTAALWKAMMAGGAAGLTSGAASYTSQHFIDGGTTADYDWKQAGIRMGVGAGVGMVSGGVGFAKAKAGVTAAQAKLNAANSKWDSLSNNVEILQKTNDAALHKATVLLNQQDKVVTTATRELKSAKATYDVANALKSGLLTKLAIAGMAIVPTGAAAGAGIAYEMLTNPAASTGGDDTPQDDPGSNDQGSYRASSAAGVMLRQLLQGD